jgi:hypothetical protein
VAEWDRLNRPMSISFEYERVYAASAQQRPIVLTNLRNVDPATKRLTGATRLPLLVDSGADITMIPDNFARVLGVNVALLQEHSLLGIGGDEVCRGPQILTAQLCGLWLPIPVMFFPASRHSHRPVLGRKGAFEAMDLVFQHKSRRMLATLAGEQPGAFTQ